MKRNQIVTMVLILLTISFMILKAQEGSVSRISGTAQTRIPPPPQLTADDLYTQLGRLHAQVELQQKYITQLQQELTAAEALCQKPEAEKEAK